MFNFFITLTLGILARILYLILIDRGKMLKHKVNKAKTLIILGSGGHTTEMSRILHHLDFNKYTPRIYIHAQTDTMSPLKLKEIEINQKDFKVVPIFRSREVGQSYITSIGTTLFAFYHAVILLWSEKPNLIICNGPGTGIPLCIGSFLLKIFFCNNAKIIFIESFCRVKTFSLTGKILYFIADHIIVQWPKLCKNNQKNVHLIK